MQPRLKTSQKWTALPQELIGQMKAVLGDSFAEQLGSAEVTVDGRIYPGEILILVGVKRAKALKQSGWEISIAYARSKDNVMKLLHLGMDAAGALFEQLFSSESDDEFPRLWQKVDFESREIFVQYTTVNPDLEAEADKLLGEDLDGIARGDWDDEIEPAHIMANLGIDPEDTEGE